MRREGGRRTGGVRATTGTHPLSGGSALAPRGAAARADAAYVVASTCPRCGAELDFAEGSNAVRCKHCASMLLVTGRRRVLSYSIPARIAPSEARTLAGFTRAAGAAPARLGEPRLVFVPYYRLSAEEIYWHRERRAAPTEPSDLTSADLGEQLVRVVAGAARRREDGKTVALASRAIERNFLACEPGGLASWSLGVRPGVLRLELFQRAALEQQGIVLRPTLGADAALVRALEPRAEIDTIQRDVLRTVLSLVYFPLWTVATGTGAAPCLTVVDGVTGAIVARDVDGAALDACEHGGESADRVLGFRPLCCPNCGWDLPVRAADVVFHCTSCERTWELVGEDLEQIACDVVQAVPDARDGGAVAHLPVWQVAGTISVSGAGIAARAGLPARLFAPAFRWRALKTLCDLGARLARATPAEPGLADQKTMPLVGCSLDRVDSLTLARMVALRLLMEDENVRHAASAGKPAPLVEIASAQTRLVWLPFAGDAYSVREPFTGYALPRRAVGELLG